MKRIKNISFVWLLLLISSSLSHAQLILPNAPVNKGLAASLDFTAGTPSTLIYSGSSAGLAQKVDKTFQSFSSSAAKATNAGLLVEPSRTNYVKYSCNFPNAGWSKVATYTSYTARNSIIPGETAHDYESDATAFILAQVCATGNFSSGVETASIWVEKTGTSKIIKFSLFNSSTAEATARFDLTTLTLATGLSGDGTGKTFGYISHGSGSGPNGGELIELVLSYTASATGQTQPRRLFIYPNDEASLLAGRHVILHQAQIEVGSYATSPIVVPSTTAVTRSADVVSLSLQTKAYDVRYTTYEGTIHDRLNVQSTSNVLTLATDITVKPEVYPTSLVASPNQVNKRVGSIASIKVWNHEYRNLHFIGDSFLDASSGYALHYYLPYSLIQPRQITIDGVGASSLPDQKTRFDATPQYWGDVLIIVDGGINTNNFVTAQTAIDGMVANLTGTKQWLYIQPIPDCTPGLEIGSPTYTAWASCQASLKSLYGSHYVDTLPTFLAGGDGSAQDIADIANGWPGSSTRLDNVHLKPAAFKNIYGPLIGNAIKLNGY